MITELKKVNLLVFILMVMTIISYGQKESKDWRNLENAIGVIPDEGYCDQPYSVINKMGEWVVAITTAPGH